MKDYWPIPNLLLFATTTVNRALALRPPPVSNGSRCTGKVCAGLPACQVLFWTFVFFQLVRGHVYSCHANILSGVHLTDRSSVSEWELCRSVATFAVCGFRIHSSTAIANEKPFWPSLRIHYSSSIPRILYLFVGNMLFVTYFAHVFVKLRSWNPAYLVILGMLQYASWMLWELKHSANVSFAQQVFRAVAFLVN